MSFNRTPTALKSRSAQFVRSAPAAKDFIRDDRPEIAFVGRSNVGKSSLLNRLLGQDGLARVSSWPGRTQMVNYFRLDGFDSGGHVWFVDLPGYGYAKASKDARRAWASLLEQYFAERGQQTLVVQLVDAVVGATPLDVEATSYLAPLVARQVFIATKIDRLTRGRWAGALAGIRRTLALDSTTPLIPFSAQTGQGVRELWREILPGSEPSSGGSATPPPRTSSRDEIEAAGRPDPTDPPSVATT